MKHLLEQEGITKEIKEGFLLYLLSASRPIHEILQPTRKDQRKALENQFMGMTQESFSYADFEHIREKLIQEIHSALTGTDKQLIMSFQQLKPAWGTVDFSRFPAIQWKLQNLQRLRINDGKKFEKQASMLRKVLGFE